MPTNLRTAPDSGDVAIIAAVKLRRTADGVIVEDRARERWVALPHAGDMLALLSRGVEGRAEAERHLEAVAGDEQAAVDPASAGLPFEARSLRAFSLWESHYEGSARMLVKRFFPTPVQRAADAFERVTRRTFPPFKPNSRFYEVPAFYVGNHAAMLADGEEMPWPSHTRYLDFELELAFVLAKPLADPTPAEAREAIGGWLVFNDWSARDVQADEARHGVFGPAVKSKTFANSIGCRRAHRRRAARLDRGDRAGAGRRRALVRGRHRRPRPRHRRDARLRLRRRAARARRRDLDRDDARLLRPRARPLDPARADGRAGDRRDRHPEQPDRRPQVRKLLAVGSALGLLGHNAFETRAGVGLVFEPFLGRRGAYALWGAYFPLMLAAATRDDEVSRRLSAFGAGIGVAGVAVHFKAWPWSLHNGLPMLDEAEGLSEDQLPAYNAVLWFWLLCSALSLPAANRSGARALRPCRLAQLPSPARFGASSLRVGARAGKARAGALEPGAARVVSGTPRWPGGARGALSLSFDNLGEAAELELGAIGPEAPLGEHFTATRVCRPCSRRSASASWPRPSSSRGSTPRSTRTS